MSLTQRTTSLHQHEHAWISAGHQMERANLKIPNVQIYRTTKCNYLIIIWLLFLQPRCFLVQAEVNDRPTDPHKYVYSATGWLSEANWRLEVPLKE